MSTLPQRPTTLDDLEDALLEIIFACVCAVPQPHGRAVYRHSPALPAVSRRFAQVYAQVRASHRADQPSFSIHSAHSTALLCTLNCSSVQASPRLRRYCSQAAILSSAAAAKSRSSSAGVFLAPCRALCCGRKCVSIGRCWPSRPHHCWPLGQARRRHLLPPRPGYLPACQSCSGCSSAAAPPWHRPQRRHRSCRCVSAP